MKLVQGIKSVFIVGATMAIILVGCNPKFTEEDKGDYSIVINMEGSTLGYNKNSGVKLLTVDRYAFKDLNKNGTLRSLRRLAIISNRTCRRSVTKNVSRANCRINAL